jgi:hypothetical protein
MALPSASPAESGSIQPSARVLAERAFHVYLDQSRAGEAPALGMFLATYPAEVGAHLELILEDYIALRGVLQPHAGLIAAGSEIGPFRLVREIGRGGMGCIWEAQQRFPRRVVALKILYPHLSFVDQSLERFEKEARACGRITHEHIVAIHEVGEDHGLHWIAMELVPGGLSLADMIAELRERGAPVKEHWLRSARLFRQIATALWCAHDAGVVHRDIKPGNILLTPEGQPKVADFGLAKIQDDLTLSRSGRLSGTPYYMSPEQAASSRLGIDLRTDIYSLGVSLYETLTLERPHQGETQGQLLERILLDDAPDPRLVAPALPKDLAAIVMKMMAKRRDRRYSSMAAVVDDLDRFLAGEPPAARVPGPLARLARAARRRKAGIAVSCALVAVFAAATVLYRDAANSRATTARSVDDALALSETHAGLAGANDQVTQELAETLGLRAGRTADAKEAWDLHFDAARLRLAVADFDGVLVQLAQADERLPSGEQDIGMRLRLADAKARALEGLFRSEERQRVLRAAHEESRALERDDFRRARHLAQYAAHCLELGRPREADAAMATLPGMRSMLLDRLMRLQRNRGPRAPLVVEARLLLAELDAACGSPEQLEEAARHFDDAERELRRSRGELDWSHLHAAWRGDRAARRAGTRPQDAELADHLRQLRASAAQARTHPLLVAGCDLELAHAHAASRDHERATDAARAALAAFAAVDESHPLALEAQAALACALLERGDAKAALSCAEAAAHGWRAIAEARSARRLEAELLVARCASALHGARHPIALAAVGRVALEAADDTPSSAPEELVWVVGEAARLEELRRSARELAR